LNHVKFWDGLDEWCELSWKDEKQWQQAINPLVFGLGKWFARLQFEDTPHILVPHISFIFLTYFSD
jgi:hypothetical protein